MKKEKEELQVRKLLVFYQFIIEQISEGVHVIDEEGRSIIYNQKMSEIESMHKDDVMGKKLLDVFPFSRGEESTLYQSLKEGKTAKKVRQTYFNDKGKEIKTINNTYPIFKDNTIIGAVEIANDVTKLERIIRENILNKENTKYTFDSIIGSSEGLQEVIENAKRVTRTSSSVLIVGETGTGKELIAQSIHHGSYRSAGPMISQNCAALPDSLIEGLLFGTAKGAFTGAIERPGLFEQAEGGTLFLDEINSLSLPLQAKLLRALQEKSIRRIGDTKDRDIDVRIIAAINEDPFEAIANERIRKDLYYRLSVVTLFIPPLRERKEDILELTEHFIKKYNYLFDMDVHGVSEEVKEYLLTYSWPGNVRELQHVIEGAMNLMIDEPIIQFSHLPVHHLRRQNQTDKEQTGNPDDALVEAIRPSISKENNDPFWNQIEESKTLREKVDEFEKFYIQRVLDKYKGNISKTAKELGLSRQSLQYRLRKYKEK